jgi:tRNA (adenine37-N6)-methyltransferase
MVSKKEKGQELFLRPVGYVRNELKTPSLRAGKNDIELGHNLEKAREEMKRIRAMISELVIAPELDGILEGLEEFSHALVVYWPHLVPEQSRNLIKVHPMGIKSFPQVGVFASCSPARPNPVLITAVKILERQNNILRVSGLEALNGSPIVDIKPYAPHYYSVEQIELPEWMKLIETALNKPESKWRSLPTMRKVKE